MFHKSRHADAEDQKEEVKKIKVASSKSDTPPIKMKKFVPVGKGMKPLSVMMTNITKKRGDLGVVEW